jgi:hypothetical protein
MCHSAAWQARCESFHTRDGIEQDDGGDISTVPACVLPCANRCLQMMLSVYKHSHSMCRMLFFNSMHQGILHQEHSLDDSKTP